MGKMDEQILVVDREYLFMNEELIFQGLLTDDEQIETIMENFKAFKEVRRGDAETNEDWKQPIPYCMLRRGNEVFLYKRLNTGGEERLHDALSIGVGGHMNYEGSTWDFNFIENMHRELEEELDISSQTFQPEVIGLINDDHDPTGVGKVHIGILVLIDLDADASVCVRETDKLEGSWIRIRDLRKTPLFDSLESWSQIAASTIEE